jgi:hypothetical protein
MNKPRKILISVAGILLFTAVAYCGWLWLLRGQKPRSAEELAQIALTASSAEEQQSAAVDLGGQSGQLGQRRGAEQPQLAAAELVQLGAHALPQMRQVFHESQSTEVRAQMILGLAQQWDLDSMPALLAAMDDPSLLIRGRAEMAVKKILTSVDDYRADDPPEKRRLALQAVRKRWDQMRASPRFPVYQERAEAKRR